jgi:folate-dependent phosphoribosylglycinamide formyltransferase PurN
VAPDYAFLALHEHPYGREMLRQLLGAGFVPRLVIEEASEIADLERRKFLDRIGGHPVAPRFDELLAGLGVRRERVADHNDERCASLLREAAPRLMVLGGTRILRPHLLELAADGCLNAHPGLLPEVRGSASVAWAIHLDQPIGCTCHFVEAGIDTGPIVARRALAVHRKDDYETLCWATIGLSGTLMAEALRAYAAGTLAARPQGDGPPARRNMSDALLEQVRGKLARGDYGHYVD